jgi:hypothetical protein
MGAPGPAVGALRWDRSPSSGEYEGVSETGRHLRLTSAEVALVLRRAAEIEAATDDLAEVDRYDPGAVEAAAGEVGLSPAAVRQAVAELRVGSLADSAIGARRRGVRRAPSPGRVRRGEPAGKPSDVVVDQRVVRAKPAEILDDIGRALRPHLFAPGRRTEDWAVFRPRNDLGAKLQRRLDFGRAIRFDGVSCVTAIATPTDGGALLRVEAELATTRASVVAGSAAAGGAVALLTGFGGALAHEPGLVIASVPMGTAIAAGGMRVRGQRWERQRAEHAEALATLVDRL